MNDMHPSAVWTQAAAKLTEDVFEQNLSVLRLGRRSRDKVREASPSGEPILLGDGGLALSVGGRILGAPGDDASMARTHESIGKGHEAVALVFGVGMGNAVRDLHRRNSARTIVYEPDPGVLRRVLEFGPVDWSGIPIYCDLDDLREDWRGVSGGRAVATLVRSPGYAEAFPEALDEVELTLQSALSTASVNENTMRVRARTWVECILQNLPRVGGTHPFLALRNQYKGVPAFIVGAGPSLSRNVHLLPEAVRKGIVFAVNSSAGLLAKQGAEFQVVASLESVDLSSHMQGIPWMDRAIRAFSLSANPATWTAGSGPLMPIYEANPAFSPVQELLRVPGLGVSGSVTTAAFSLAELLGCSPIVFVGQDLAFPGGRVHAEGAQMDGSRVRVDRESGRLMYDWCEDARKASSQACGSPTHERLIEVDAWGGGPQVATSAMWNLVRDWLDKRARDLATSRPEVELINATEGGSRIPGFAEQPLAEILARFEERNITPESMMDTARACSEPVDGGKLRAWAEKQAKRTRAAGEAAQALSKRVKQAQAAARDGDPKKVGRAYDRMAEAEARLREATAAQPLLDAWCCASIDAVLKAGAQAPDTTHVAGAARVALHTEALIAEAVALGASEMEPRLLDVASDS